VSIKRNQTGPDVWTFGAVNAITWFSAAILGPFLVDPICYSRFFGRRGSVFLAAAFSLASTIGASRATTWQGYFIARLFLGIGIGAKASIVPIWESEVLPPSKRGRVLVSWQVFAAIGIFAGSVATYIFRTNWRNQVLSGAIPALILLILTYLCCESPRWLIIQAKFPKAFETLVRLRKERILAAEEFCYIYFQIQNERAFARGKKEGADLNHPEDKLSYSQRLPKVVTIAR
jgi:MFS family permease